MENTIIELTIHMCITKPKMHAPFMLRTTNLLEIDYLLF